MELLSRLARYGALALAAFVILGAGIARAAGEGVFRPETFTLDNGMQVVVVSNHRVPVVTHMAWYKVGSADEEPGKSGIAHFLEHLMFKGTKNLAPGEFSATVSRNGGRENAFTSLDYTGYFQTVAKDRLEIVMRMEADRMSNLTLSEEVVEPERLVILEERRQRTDNSPGAVLREHVSASLYLNHPYQRPVIGWEHEIRALTVEDILAFYRQWYAPNNAVLVVAGDITAEEVRPLAEKYYGVIPRGPDIVRARPQEPPQKAERRVIHRDPKVGQPALSRHYLAPSYTTGASEHAYALQVGAELLGGGSTSLLYRELVIERKLAVAAGAYYGPDGLGPGTFVAYASPRPEVSMEDLEAAISELLDTVAEDGFAAEEIERAKKRIAASAVYARDSLRAGARVLGSALTSGRTIEDVESWPDRIAEVTTEQVKAAMRHVLDENRSVTALLLPEESSEEQAQL